jgi:hypothetical protein
MVTKKKYGENLPAKAMKSNENAEKTQKTQKKREYIFSLFIRQHIITIKQ